MALSALTVFEVRTGGSDTNGGGFVTGASGTDHTLQDAAQYSVTDAVTAGTTTITSVTANFGTDVVGNILYIQGGTGAIVAGWYQITARGSSTSITVDRSTGLTIGTGATLKIGGALLSPAIAAISAVAGNKIYIKNGTYSITSASTNIAGGCINNVAGSTVWIGYSLTRTPQNTDTQPVLQLNVSTATLVGGAASTAYINLAFDGNSQTSAKFSSNAGFYRCTISGFNTASTGTVGAEFCKITANAASVLSGGTVSFSEIYSNTAPQITTTLLYSLVYNNTGATTDGASCISAIGNHVYGNGRDGIIKSSSAHGSWANNHVENNVRYGFNPAIGTTVLLNNSHYNNTSGGVNITAGVPAIEVGTIAVTAGSVFVDAATNNFALNNTASRGALLRAAGFPATFPLGTTASYSDIGAAQHEETVTASETSHAFA